MLQCNGDMLSEPALVNGTTECLMKKPLTRQDCQARV